MFSNTSKFTAIGITLNIMPSFEIKPSHDYGTWRRLKVPWLKVPSQNIWHDNKTPST